MKKVRIIVVCLIIFLVITIGNTHAATSGFPLRNQNSHITKSEYVDGEIIVKYKKEKVDLETLSGRIKAASLSSSSSLNIKKYIKKSNLSILSVNDPQTFDSKIAEMRSDPNVAYAEPNYKRYISDISTNDTYQDRLWGLDNTGQTIAGDQGTIAGKSGADIHANNAWAINEGTNANVIVAVIDTGVAYNHPDLASNMWDGSNCKDDTGVAIVGGCNHGYNFADNNNNPLPVDSSHGTHVSGTIAAIKNNGKGIAGVAPHVKIMALRFGFDVASEVQAIDFAIQNGAKVINASFGGTQFSQAEYDAISRFRDAGGIFVAAAGNNGTNNDTSHFYPSDYDLSNIISVAATDQNDNLASFSDFGPTSVDIGAPGVNILSTIADSLKLSESFSSTTVLSVPSNWTKGGVTTNHWGVLSSSGNKALYGDVNQFSYTANANTSIDSPVIDLGGTTGATISFQATCNTEYTTTDWRDYMELEYSSDGTTFTPAQDPFSGGDFQWDEAYLNGNTGPITGSYYFDGVTIPTEDLTSNFKFRYRWVTNATNNHYAGCSVDNISVDAFGDGSDEKYDYYSGTSMATPHVVGLAALLFGYQPTLTAAQVRSDILSSGDSLSSLSGKIVSGKRINAGNALLLVDPTKQITSFILTSPTATGTISESPKTISFIVPHNTVLTALVPTITIDGASISPASGVAQDFTNPVTYTVTAHDGSTQAYVATAILASSTDANMISFASAVPTATGTITATSVSLMVPYGTDLSALPVSVTISDGASVSPAAGTISFTNATPMIFTVTAQDGVTTQAYSVTVSVALPSDVTALSSAITSAQGIHDSAIEGTSPGQYATGTRAILQTAIAAASVLTNASAQSTVDAMVVTLNHAVAVFQQGMVDNIPPVIVLLGSSNVTVNFGASYVDAGATATDNLEGDVTTDIVTVNPVNTSSAGTYTVTYNVKDLEGNLANQVTRTVIVNHPVVSSGGGGGGGGYVPLVVTIPVVIPQTLVQNQIKDTATSDVSKMTISTATSSESISAQTSQTVRYVFHRSLRLGVTSSDVITLQKFLNNHEFLIATSGPGSKGKESNYFGIKTLKALKAFQKSVGLPASGFLGPMTQKIIEGI